MKKAKLYYEKLRDVIQWKGTPGVGDFMCGLNIAHSHSKIINKPVKIIFNWFWNVKDQYHFEDPELTIERLEYIHNFYKDRNNVIVEHNYSPPKTKEINEVYVRMTGMYTRYLLDHGLLIASGMLSKWEFRQESHLPIDRKKVVFWTDKYNADIVRSWKRLINHNEWDQVISNFEMCGYEPVELTYRTPVREAMYHINTAAFCICYDGLWHYVAKNFHKPLIVISRSGITRTHTPEALTLDETNVLHYSRNFNVEKRRKILMHFNRCDRFNWDQKYPSVYGDGLRQLKSRINLYRTFWNNEFANEVERQKTNHRSRSN